MNKADKIKNQLQKLDGLRKQQTTEFEKLHDSIAVRQFMDIGMDQRITAQFSSRYPHQYPDNFYVQLSGQPDTRRSCVGLKLNNPPASKVNRDTLVDLNGHKVTKGEIDDLLELH